MTCSICGGSLERGWRIVNRYLFGVYVQNICLKTSCYSALNKLMEVG